MTIEARAEPNLFEFCLARRNSTKSNEANDEAPNALTPLHFVFPQCLANLQ